MSDYPAIPFPDKLVYLEQVSIRLSDALQQTEASIRRVDREYADTKKYMADHRGEIDPHEMFQNELLLKQTDGTGAFTARMRDRIVKLEGSPCSARIDFREEQEKEGRLYYIERFAFQYEDEPLMLDWCALVFGMFYDCEVGVAGFMAPAGWTVEELTRKRWFKIRNGAMEHASESSANVQDDVLQKGLSHASNGRVKSVISTIQREQSQIIRNEKEGIVITQGVAGSGKTSTALRRIVSLLYRLKGRLTAGNITIFSPNKVLGDYILGVIPEFGEEPIYKMGFGELAEIQLEKVTGFGLDRDPFEMQNETWSEKVWLKSALDFASLMDQYVERPPEFILIPMDHVYGNFPAKGGWIWDRFLTYEACSVEKRSTMAAGDIRDRSETNNIMEQEVSRPRIMLKRLSPMLTMKDTLVVYEDFYKRMGIPEYFVMATRKTLEWADVYPFLYLHSAFQGLKESHITRYLVIDEMQDYTPVQYTALNRVFPCRETTLGDLSQPTNPNHLRGLGDLRTIYGRAQLVELNKSYRSVHKVMRFAEKVHRVSVLEPARRHGELPTLIPCLDTADEIRKIGEAIRRFRTGKNVSLGIILKTDVAAKDMYEMLARYDGVEENQVEENQVERNGEKACGISLLTRESTSFQNGISITSVRVSKGLEFDEVLIPRTDCRTYIFDLDRGLLYVAYTRAMHRPTLMCSGKETELISGQPPFL